MKMISNILFIIMAVMAIVMMIYVIISMYRSEKELKESLKRCDDIFEKEMEEIRKKYEDKDKDGE